MLTDVTLPVPASLASLLAWFAALFTVPSFRTFCGLACGFLSQTGSRTVCGMLSGAGLSRLWPHDRAHWFFSRARWDPDELGLAAVLVIIWRSYEAWACFGWISTRVTVSRSWWCAARELPAAEASRRRLGGAR
jgi:hypothetical protein